MADKKENISKELAEIDLGELIRKINSKFKVHKKQKYSIIMWSLVCWQNGYWSVSVTDDWHKWMRKRVKETTFLYLTPEMACIEFLRFIKRNNIKISELQSK